MAIYHLYISYAYDLYAHLPFNPICFMMLSFVYAHYGPIICPLCIFLMPMTYIAYHGPHGPITPFMGPLGPTTIRIIKRKTNNALFVVRVMLNPSTNYIESLKTKYQMYTWDHTTNIKCIHGATQFGCRTWETDYLHFSGYRPWVTDYSHCLATGPGSRITRKRPPCTLGFACCLFVRTNDRSDLCFGISFGFNWVQCLA